MSTTKIIVHFNDGQAAECTVEYDYQKATRGYREPGGQQIDPDEPAYCEINAVYIGSDDLDISGWDVIKMDRLQEDLTTAHEEGLQGEYEDAMEARAERRRERAEEERREP